MYNILMTESKFVIEDSFCGGGVVAYGDLRNKAEKAPNHGFQKI